MIVTAQSETPGLGTVVTDRKRTVTIGSLFSSSGKADKDALPPNPIPRPVRRAFGGLRRRMENDRGR